MGYLTFLLNDMSRVPPRWSCLFTTFEGQLRSAVEVLKED
jgi:hypothetical protein